jgi:IS605 OrfB family transposase
MGYDPTGNRMEITTQIKIDIDDKKDILLLITRFNAVCNHLSKIAFDEKLFYWLKLQRRTYHEIKDIYKITAAEARVAIRKVAYAYTDKAKRETLSQFRSLGGIPLSTHIYRNNKIRFYGIEVPVITRKDVILPKYPKQAILSYRNGKLIIYQTIVVSEPEQYEPKDWLGCDLGIKNILTDSGGKIYSGGQLNNIRKRHNKIRVRLQSKRTRSSRRLLNKRRYKESNFTRDINHQISKKVVEKAILASLGISLEDLTGIRKSTRVRRADRSNHSSWGFWQLRFFIEYKSKLHGVPFVLVDPRNTSRTCPECGCVDKRNRKSQAWFKCIECGYGHHADTVAAINISRRAVGNQPYAPSQEDVQIPINADSCRDVALHSKITRGKVPSK